MYTKRYSLLLMALCNFSLGMEPPEKKIGQPFKSINFNKSPKWKLKLITKLKVICAQRLAKENIFAYLEEDVVSDKVISLSETGELDVFDHETGEKNLQQFNEAYLLNLSLLEELNFDGWSRQQLETACAFMNCKKIKVELIIQIICELSILDFTHRATFFNLVKKYILQDNFCNEGDKKTLEFYLILGLVKECFGLLSCVAIIFPKLFNYNIKSEELSINISYIDYLIFHHSEHNQIVDLCNMLVGSTNLKYTLIDLLAQSRISEDFNRFFSLLEKLKMDINEVCVYEEDEFIRQNDKALTLAVLKLNPLAVERLLSKNADPFKLDFNLKTPIDYCLMHDIPDHFFDKLSYLKILCIFNEHINKSKNNEEFAFEKLTIDLKTLEISNLILSDVDKKPDLEKGFEPIIEALRNQFK